MTATRIIAEKLRKVREILGLRQAEIAQYTGMTQRDISLLENGKREFIPSEYIVFVNGLGLDIRWLFNGRDFEEDQEYLFHFKQKIFSRHLTGKDLLEFYGENKDKVYREVEFPGENIMVVRTEIQERYTKKYNESGFLEQLPRIFLPWVDPLSTSLRCFEVNTDAMLPSLLPGDFVLSRPAPLKTGHITEGSVYMVLYNQRLLLGRLRHEKSHWRVNFDHQGYKPVKLTQHAVDECWEVMSRFTAQVNVPHPAPDLNLQHLLKRIEELEKKIP